MIIKTFYFLLILISILILVVFNFSGSFVKAETSFLSQCADFGIWDESNSVCRLTKDLFQGLIIKENNIVFDCNGHSLIGNGSGVGIELYYVDNVVIKNCHIGNFSTGIRLFESSNNQIYDNNVFDNDIGISVASEIYLTCSNNNSIYENDIYNNHDGLIIFGGSNNKVFHNNFIDNQSKLSSSQAVNIGSNIFDNGSLSGGNYWSDYDCGEEGCIDENTDGFCDNPYVIFPESTLDNYPFIEKNGWEKSVCGNNVCEQDETFENCYQDCLIQGIEKYFPYWNFSKNEKYFPVSFYFDNDADTSDNPQNYRQKIGKWNSHYVYIHPVEDKNYFTIP